MECIFDFPTRARFVAECVAASDTVKGSHIQRSPLSMGAQSEPEESDLQKLKKKEIALGHSVRDATA